MQNEKALCAPLYDKTIPKLSDPLREIFRLQQNLQRNLAARGKALDYDSASFTQKVAEISNQWRNLTLEFAELLERLPYKEWKSYKSLELSDEEMLETKYEYIDMFHFFLNIGLCLGIDGDEFERLYVTKNKENIDRQKRGY
jgi:dimeric dUTPase (all-alpha-NTP-PPase superfamily)